MGFHGIHNAKTKEHPEHKKKKFGIKKLAKEILKKTHKQKADDNEALIEESGNHRSGRSIEVLPEDLTNEDCSCSLSQDESCDVDRSYCDVCGRTYGHSRRSQRRVRFSPDLEKGDTSNTGSKGENCGKKKRKKHKKLKKARKVTWKAMKKSWKYMKAGLMMIADMPGLPTGTVQMMNIVNNPTASPHKHKPYF